MPPEDALLSAADGDFGLMMIAILLIFVLSICGALIRWIMSTIPQQMEQDRQAMCDKLADLIVAMKDDHKTQDVKVQAILDATKRIETLLDFTGKQ
jgi:hypothetical protein